MLLPLDDESRAKLVRLALFLCGSAVLLAPLAGRSSMEIAQEQAAFGAGLATPNVPRAASANDVFVERDPFAPSLQSTPASVSSGAALPALLPAQTSVTVRAIVSGEAARALVDDGAQTRIVEVGDSIGTSKIVRIDNTGVTLANGLSLPLQTASTP